MTPETAEQRIAREEAEWQRQQVAEKRVRARHVATARLAKLDRLIAEAEREAAPLRAEKAAIEQQVAALGPKPASADAEYRWTLAHENAVERLREINAGDGRARSLRLLGKHLAEAMAERETLVAELAALEGAAP